MTTAIAISNDVRIYTDGSKPYELVGAAYAIYDKEVLIKD